MLRISPLRKVSAYICHSNLIAYNELYTFYDTKHFEFCLVLGFNSRLHL